MKKFTLLFVILFILLINSEIIAQTAHEKLKMQYAKIESFVTVSNENTLDCYAVGIFKECVFITELSNDSLPLGIVNDTCRLFSTSKHGIILKGGFFDEDNDIVVYGYVSPNTNNGIIIKIYMTNGVADSIAYVISGYSNTKITDGCYSRLGNDKTYSFIVNNNHFMQISADLTNTPNAILKKFPIANIMSVSWDSINSKHVLSGCIVNNETVNFIGTISDTIANTNNTEYFYLYKILNTSNSLTNKHILSRNLDSTAYLLQEIKGKILWYMHVNYLNGTVYSNKFFNFNSDDLFIIDIAHNLENLFVLGNHSGNGFANRYIAQIDLQNATNVIVKAVTDISLLNTFGLELDEGYLNNICYNYSTGFVQAAGAFNNNAYIVENYDMNNSSCDSTISIEDINLNYFSSIDTSLCHTTSLFNIWDGSDSIHSQFNANYVLFILNRLPLCVSSEIDNYDKIINEKQTKKTTIEKNTEIKITNNKTFICKNFDGICNYSIYNILGKVILEGQTINGNYNELNINKAGLYLIKVIDESKNIKIEKIIISE